MSRLAFELRRRLGLVTVAVAVSIAPSTVPEWRLSPMVPPAVVLAVGDPVPLLGER